jgi:hypothetical protein
MVGVGGAALVVWGVTGGLYLAEQDTVESECDAEHLCSQAGLDAADTANTLGIVNTVALFGGIALVGAGLAVALTAPDGGDEQATIVPVVTHEGVWLGVRGRF